MKQKLSTKEIAQSLKFLARASTTARILLTHKEICVHDIFATNSNVNDDRFIFHVNGRCGSIKNEDRNYFGLHTNNLMWVEGECEIPDKKIGVNSRRKNALMVSGIHEGIYKARLIFD